MSSKRELELMIKLQNQGKESLKNYESVIPISQNRDRIVRESDSVIDILGFNPELLRPQNNNENPETSINPDIQQVRSRRFRQRISKLSLPFDLSKSDAESELDYFTRIQTIYQNLPKQETFDAKENQNEILTIRKHLQEIMDDDDIEIVLNDAPLNDIDNIRIINNTWASFVRKLKERFKKVDVRGFQNFTNTYLNDYISTSGVSGLQPIINVPEPVIINEGDYEDTKADDNNEFFYIEIILDEDGNPTADILSYHFTINKRSISVTYDELRNNGQIIRKENNLNRTKFGAMFRNSPTLRDFLSSKLDNGQITNKTLREQVLKLVNTYSARNVGTSQDNPLSSIDLITDINTGGIGLSKRSRLHKQIIEGQIRAGNTSIPYKGKNSKYKFLFKKLKSVL